MADDWYDISGSTGTEYWKGDKGIKVIGPNISDGEITVWHYGDNKEMAHLFAKQLCKDTLQSVLVVQVIGRWRPQDYPIEYIAAED